MDMTKFFVGIRPKSAYMLPDGTNMMVSSSAYWMRKTMKWEKRFRPRNCGLLFLDSGGYVFFNSYNDYPFSISNYQTLVSRLKPNYYASLDYPCEPELAEKMDDFSIERNIEKTVQNAVIMADSEIMIPKSIMVPVIQGHSIEQYAHCLSLYQQNNLIRPFMAIGTLCNRSRNPEIVDVIKGVHDVASDMGVQRLHLFGVKQTPALEAIRPIIYSQDSAALFFSANRKMKREWNGRKYAKTAEEKRQAVNAFLDRLTKHGYEWKE